MSPSVADLTRPIGELGPTEPEPTGCPCYVAICLPHGHLIDLAVKIIDGEATSLDCLRQNGRQGFGCCQRLWQHSHILGHGFERRCRHPILLGGERQWSRKFPIWQFESHQDHHAMGRGRGSIGLHISVRLQAGIACMNPKLQPDPPCRLFKDAP